MSTIPKMFVDPKFKPIHCIEMHTTGEPTRIIYSGFPGLTGTLLEQRAEAKRKHDKVRTQLMLEPRGHFDMYGALLRPDTELVRSGEAHIGVLFMTNDGFSTMCGHATIALGRVLVDTHDLNMFPKRNELEFDPERKITEINLHAPCGLVKISVPTTRDGSMADVSRPVSFISVPSFVTGVQVEVLIPEAQRWPEVGSRGHVTVDFSYGGAFYCMVSAVELGFPEGLKTVDLKRLSHAAKSLKTTINNDVDMRKYFHHPDHNDLGFLYSIMVVDDKVGAATHDSAGAETGLCFFADQQIDRSPTGGGVAARAALAFGKGMRAKGERWTYHSLVSNAFDGVGSFVGTILDNPEPADRFRESSVRVKVEGKAYYTGHHSFVVEESDVIGQEGFSFNHLDP